MNKYIEREAVLEIVNQLDDRTALVVGRKIVNLYAADVVEVVHGRWEHGYNQGKYGIWCSRCKTGFAYSDSYEVLADAHKYCPNCGARMDGE